MGLTFHADALGENPSRRRGAGCRLEAREAREGVAVVRKADLLEDVSVADRVAALEFTVGQVCRMAGITKMQLDYWTQRGDIPTSGNKQRLYDADAVETVMLIKQARDLGFDVNAAISAAGVTPARALSSSAEAASRKRPSSRRQRASWKYGS